MVIIKYDNIFIYMYIFKLRFCLLFASCSLAHLLEMMVLNHRPGFERISNQLTKQLD